MGRGGAAGGGGGIAGLSGALPASAEVIPLGEYDAAAMSEMLTRRMEPNTPYTLIQQRAGERGNRYTAMEVVRFNDWEPSRGDIGGNIHIAAHGVVARQGGELRLTSQGGGTFGAGGQGTALRFNGIALSNLDRTPGSGNADMFNTGVPGTRAPRARYVLYRGRMPRTTTAGNIARSGPGLGYGMGGDVGRALPAGSPLRRVYGPTFD